jgi:wyosine [tRNA(Phe)-imidazoG37] synthetase (radical SAM superfamily)
VITFGPVPSRRLGRSLGINNIPPKACSYSCVYCQVGPTRSPESGPRTFYVPREILRSVAGRLEALAPRGEPVDWLTFVPDGEPTLDANLAETIDLLRPLGVPIAVISNASLVWREDVRAALARADWLSLKVDATYFDIWRRVNRPSPALRLDAILDGIERLAKDYRGTFTTETMLAAGVNDQEESVSGVAAFLRGVAPTTAHIAVPTRPPAEASVEPSAEASLVRAYEIFRAQVPRVECLIGDEGNAFSSAGLIENELLAIAAVRPLREEAVRALLATARAQWEMVERLLGAGALRRVDYRGERYCARAVDSPRHESLSIAVGATP